MIVTHGLSNTMPLNFKGPIMPCTIKIMKKTHSQVSHEYSYCVGFLLCNFFFIKELLWTYLDVGVLEYVHKIDINYITRMKTKGVHFRGGAASVLHRYWDKNTGVAPLTAGKVSFCSKLQRFSVAVSCLYCFWPRVEVRHHQKGMKE